MRQVMPHRNNIGVELPACKSFLGSIRPFGPVLAQRRMNRPRLVRIRLEIFSIESAYYVSRRFQRALKPQLPAMAVMRAA